MKMKVLFGRLMFLGAVCWFFAGCGKEPKNGSPGHGNAELDAENSFLFGAIVRGDTSTKSLALVFTGDEYADGGQHIREVLNRHQVSASFFLTGNFYRTAAYEELIRQLRGDGHYLGAHSDRHLLYCDWQNRDSLLIDEPTFRSDLLDNYQEMKRFGISTENAFFFLPPYEWYNDSIARWTSNLGLQLINITYGTLSHADYTTPEMPYYRDSETIYQSILNFERSRPAGLNGFILLVHIGTDPLRTDKFYHRLDELLAWLKAEGYVLRRIDDLL